MEEVYCVLCGPSPTQVFRREPDRLHHKGGPFTFVQCQRCGLVYLNPRPSWSEMAQFYPQDYLPFASEPEDGESPWRRWDRRYGLGRRRRALEAWKGGGRLLDVGCATGGFLAEMRRGGRWQALGVEPSPWASTYAREKLGLEVFTGLLEEAAFPDQHFDAVTFWDTFEHIFDPLATLGEVARILKSDGILLLNLPNLDSWDARLLGGYWAGLDAPRHLYVFSQDTIRITLERAGFGVLKALCFTGRYHSFALSLRFLLEGVMEDRPPRRALLRAVNSLVVRALAFPYFAVVDRLGKGSTLTLVARRFG